MNSAISAVPSQDSLLGPFFDKLRLHLDLDLLDKAIASCGKSSQRRRRLLALAVALLVVASALFRAVALTRLASLLGLVRASALGSLSVASNALVAARSRLGAEPLLAFLPVWAWGQTARLPLPLWRGLRLCGLDGSKVRLQASAANVAHYGLPPHGRGSGRLPLMRWLQVVDLATRVVLDLEQAPYQASTEFGLAEQLMRRLAASCLVVLDGGFFSLSLLGRIHLQGSHWLLPLKARTRVRFVRRLGPGDDVVELTPCAKARQRAPWLPETMQARRVVCHRRGYRPRTLLTSLLDPVAYPAKELGDWYSERWEVELGLGEQKTVLLGAEPLRSRTPVLAYQEAVAAVIAYNLLRLQAAEGALRQGVSAKRLSFVAVLEAERSLWVAWSMARAEVRQWVEQQAQQAVLPVRRERRCAREVHRRTSKFPPRKPRSAAAEAFAMRAADARRASGHSLRPRN